MAGWDVTVVTEDQTDERPLRILGVRGYDLESVLTFPVHGSCLQAIAVRAELYRADERVRRLVRTAAETDSADIRVGGDAWPDDLDAQAGLVSHRLSTAARAFKAQALAAAASAAEAAFEPASCTEVFRRAAIRRLALA
jgi:hypothetical protein